MRGVLNDATNVVHRYSEGRPDCRTTCGATSRVTHDQLREVPVDRAISDEGASRCGRCFADAGGY